MKRTTAFLAVIAFCAVCSTVYALYSVTDKGTWPESWPKELEPLRKQSRTFNGPVAPQHKHYEIPFTKREDFESAWPHLLKVKSKGAPVFLVRGPSRLGGTKAGVWIHCPPVLAGNQVMPEAPLPGDPNDSGRWLYTTCIELVVDGNIVDLNRIPLPQETPIIDKRFEDGPNKSLNRSGGQRGN
jgi:hypothetical protein